MVYDVIRIGISYFEKCRRNGCFSFHTLLCLSVALQGKQEPYRNALVCS